MTLARCITKAGKLVSPAERAALVQRAAELKQGGMSAKDAEQRAVQELAESLRQPYQPPAPIPKDATLAQRQVDPVMLKHGLDQMPIAEPADRAAQMAARQLYAKAESPEYVVDQQRLSTATNLIRTESDSGTMLRSANPVMRMVAQELLEHGAGAGGRRSSAAIGRHMLERELTGRAHNEVLTAYKAWARQTVGASGMWKSDLLDGDVYSTFSRQVATEIELRRTGQLASERTVHPQVKAAADSLEAAFERTRLAQINAKTLGHKALPDSSVGYMPHRLSGEKLAGAPVEVKRALHQGITDQFVQRLGFDLSFADKLATKYLDRAQRRSLGGFVTDTRAIGTGADGMIEEALKDMGLTKPELTAALVKSRQGAQKHTRHRLDLDLLAPIKLADGKTTNLLEFMDSDPLSLLKGQVSRVAGEVALTRVGIMGKPGVDLARRAMEFGADGEKVTAKELEAFDRAMAEMLGMPVGGARSKLADRAIQVTAMARLGGLVWQQGAELINGMAALGAGRALSVVPSLRRLRAEAIALSRGQKVEGSILSSLEHDGAEFGTEGYRMAFPFESPTAPHMVYGGDTPGAVDRILRHGSHAFSVMSGWRAMHMAQQRGVAEQIVRKALTYIRKGEADAALKDMGFTPEVVAHVREHMDKIAEFTPDGRLKSLDISNLPDTTIGHSFVQAVHRGASQIIQGSFIGERGAWAHNDLLRVLLQFRSFGLVAMEKQWTRQAANYGAVQALGIMLGSMSLALPLHMARVHTNAIGMSEEKRREYLARQLDATSLARATFNYVGMTGLAGDFADVLGTVTGVPTMVAPRGTNRTHETDFVGSAVAPAAGLANDLFRGIQNSDGDVTKVDPSKLVRSLPFAGLPGLRQGVNALFD